MDLTDWTEKRRQGLGASDAPVVAGVSPWKTPLQLWEEKTGRSTKEQGNWATDRGNNLEPKARANFELVHGEDFPPEAFVYHKEFSHLFANLDGYNAAKREILEIKCPGRDDHEKALAGKIPEKYIPQLVHQLAVTDALVNNYWSFNGESGVLVRFERNAQLEAELLQKENDFWKLVQMDTPPEPTDRDYRVLKGDEAAAIFEALLSAKRQRDVADAAYDEAMEKAKALLGENRRVRYGDIRLQQVFTKGAIDWQKIPEIKALTPAYLEQFRKRGSTRISPSFPKS